MSGLYYFIAHDPTIHDPTMHDSCIIDLNKLKLYIENYATGKINLAEQNFSPCYTGGNLLGSLLLEGFLENDQYKPCVKISYL